MEVIYELDETQTVSIAGSDYGSDLDDDTWEHVFSQSQSQLPPPTIESPVTIAGIDEPVLPHDDDADTQEPSLRLARIRDNLEKALAGLNDMSAQIQSRSQPIEIQYEDAEPSSSALRKETPEVREKEVSPTPEPDTPDKRSPIARFRTRPKKPLSVTDIVSPAWCELQYWYSLTRYGRVRKTAAMKAGSKIHKEKEMEDHIEVPVDAETKEDRMGLRMWNVIGGLRRLRATGRAREVEVFGVVHGEVIIGIIDELTHTSPDEAMEEEIQQSLGNGKKKTKGKEKAMPANQRTMNDFFGGAGSSVLEEPSSRLSGMNVAMQTVYLVDIKTRQSKTIPKLGSQMRATQMQLMLYRRLLSDLAANNVEADLVFDRYNLNAEQSFSDTFMAQMAQLDLSCIEDAEDEPGVSESDSLEELLTHNTLRSLWTLMITEISRTISPSSISPLLTAEFRAADDKDNVLVRRCFAFDEEGLERYVHSEMQWWRGEREAQGVDVEEAYKCRICEFSEDCTWRIGKIEEATQKSRARRSIGNKAVPRTRKEYSYETPY